MQRAGACCGHEQAEHELPITNANLPHRTLIANHALRGVLEQLQNRMPEVQRQQIEAHRTKIDLEGIITALAKNQSEILDKVASTAQEDAEFTKIDAIEPWSEDLQLLVEVVENTLIAPGVADAVVGDETGVVSVALFGREIDDFVPGRTLVLQNGRAWMRDGCLMLRAQRKQAIPNTEVDMSEPELEMFGVARICWHSIPRKHKLTAASAEEIVPLDAAEKASVRQYEPDLAEEILKIVETSDAMVSWLREDTKGAIDYALSTLFKQKLLKQYLTRYRLKNQSLNYRRML